MMLEPTVFSTVAQLSEGLAEEVIRISHEAIRQKGAFSIGLSGGSLPSILGQVLTASGWVEKVDWEKWHVFFVDERCVPLDHPDSNYKLCNDCLFFRKGVNILPKNIHKYNPKLSPEEAARDYEQQIHAVFGKTISPNYPHFDMLLLGFGPDGHICSLFPNHKLLLEKDRLVCAIFDSPKPPPQRITITLPVVNSAKNIYVVASGQGKVDIVQQIFEGDRQLPVQKINPTEGTFRFFLDRDASSKLPSKTISSRLIR
eukprot:Sdes_comp16245_c0_seq1m5546